MRKAVILLISIIIGLSLCNYFIEKFWLAPIMVDLKSGVRLVNNPKIVYEFIPKAYVIDGFVNNRGFKDSDFTLEKPENLIRIAMLGDSITQGIFVPLGETFSDELEKLLNLRARETQSPLRYEVMNFGVGGYNLQAEAQILKEKVLIYKPDIVVLNSFFNDDEPIPALEAFFISNPGSLSEREQILLIKKYAYDNNSIIRKIERDILYRSGLYLFLAYKLSGLTVSRDRRRLSRIKNLFSHHLVADDCISGNFGEIDKLRKQYGFRFLICAHPLFTDLDDALNEAIVRWAGIFNFDYFLMSAYYKREKLTYKHLQLENKPQDFCHPNKFGHTLIAKAIFTELKKRNFLESGM